LLPRKGKPSLPRFHFHNHFKFLVTYHEDPAIFDGVRITAFDVQPTSMRHEQPASDATRDPLPENNPATYLGLQLENGQVTLPVIYSYQVEWIEESDLPWADRWDVYVLHSRNNDNHVFVLVNSIVILLLVTAVATKIGMRALRKELAQKEETLEQGLRVILQSDLLFVPPQTHPKVLVALVGTGVQTGVCVLTVLCFVQWHWTHVKEGQLVTSGLIVYALLGVVGGFVSVCFYRFCNPTSIYEE
jgi:transmembrane 9 superfamily protein 2/4